MADAGAITRFWRRTDEDTLVRYADNYKIWINLKDRFPHPYTRLDAEVWIARCVAEGDGSTHFAIDLEGAAIGGIGFDALPDVNRLTAEIGYWVAEPFWGRGVATAALQHVTQYAFRNFPFERLQAHVFAWNPASARVLQKAGYTLEGRLRRNMIKDGRIGDSLLFARLR